LGSGRTGYDGSGKGDFQPGWTETGYTVLGWDMTAPADRYSSIAAELLHAMNSTCSSSDRLQNQIQQKLKGILKKLRQKEDTFLTRLDQSDQSDQYRQQGRSADDLRPPVAAGYDRNDRGRF
jgi:hypothetical protein